MARCLKLSAHDSAARTVRAELDQVLHAAAAVPCQVAATCRNALVDTWEVANRGNRTVLSDVVVGTHLLLAAVRSSEVNVQVNLRMASPSARQQAMTATIAACIGDADEAANRTLDRCAKRMSNPR